MLGLVLTTLGVWAFILAFHWARSGSPSAKLGAWYNLGLVVVVGIVVGLALLWLGGGVPIGFGGDG